MRWPVVFVAGFALILFCDGIACSAAELIINVAEAGSDDGEMKSLPEEGKTSTAVTYNNGFVKPSNTRSTSICRRQRSLWFRRNARH